ncbi:MAG: phosphoenolpyruvate--protein phosphotransferase, partial [Ruminococcus sp.]|nr:phosphoenolpyruvate--protein phosphotransferase [Ruminococcus sp.]
MRIFKGKGVYGAVAVGRAQVFKRQEAHVRRIRVDDTAAELERLEAAKAMAIEQLSGIYEKALREVGETNAQIFDIHMMMIEDDDYNDSIKGIIETQSVNAEYAVAVTSDTFAEMFASMEDSYMQARSADVRDISNRIIACLSDGEKSEHQAEECMIVCADDLAPSETVALDKDKVLAFVTAFGSANSH